MLSVCFPHIAPGVMVSGILTASGRHISSFCLLERRGRVAEHCGGLHRADAGGRVWAMLGCSSWTTRPHTKRRRPSSAAVKTHLTHNKPRQTPRTHAPPKRSGRVICPVKLETAGRTSMEHGQGRNVCGSWPHRALKAEAPRALGGFCMIGRSATKVALLSTCQKTHTNCG